MFSQPLQLVCGFLAFSVIHSVNAQGVSIATENGIVSAAGRPEPTQSVSYVIEGAPMSSITTSPTLASSTHPSASDSSSASAEGEPKLASDNQHGLTISGILGITAAVVLSVVGIIIAVLIMHKKRKQTVARAKRKSIMDVEFAGDTKTKKLQRSDTNKTINATIGYFDIAKPLPAVVKEVEDDRLSRSSTIIGDAAEVARINRKASRHQKKERATREQVRERNHALQILITNEDNRTSVLPSSPLTPNPATPVDADSNFDSNAQGACTDGDGDPFCKRPSKI